MTRFGRNVLEVPRLLAFSMIVMLIFIKRKIRLLSEPDLVLA